MRGIMVAVIVLAVWEAVRGRLARWWRAYGADGLPAELVRRSQ